MNGPHLAFFGNLTRDPDKRFSQNDGNEYVRVTVAVNTAMGEDRRETEYVAVNLYGNHMRSAMARATKGTPVYISGRMSHREYQRQDGGRGCELHVHARDFRILHRAPDGYQPATQTGEEVPQDQEQPGSHPTHQGVKDAAEQAVDQDLQQAMNEALEDALDDAMEQDLDFNDPLPIGPEPAAESPQDEAATPPPAEEGTTPQEKFESAVETAAFPD